MTTISIQKTPLAELEITALVYTYTEVDPTGQHNDGMAYTAVEEEILNPELHAAATFAEFNFRCDCCGSPRLRYACSVVHKPTMRGYRIGRDCAQAIADAQRLNLGTISETLKDRFVAKHRVEKWIAANPQHADIVAWAKTKEAHGIARDIVSKLARWGSISEGQVNLMYKLQKQAAERAAAEPATTAPAPVGRCEVEVELLGTKVSEGFRGATVTKLLCRVVETGAKVWFTQPMGWARPTRGDRVVVRANWERSERDEFFGFGRRPHFVRETFRATGQEAAQGA